jgi:hypothetical protein
MGALLGQERLLMSTHQPGRCFMLPNRAFTRMWAATVSRVTSSISDSDLFGSSENTHAGVPQLY